MKRDFALYLFLGWLVSFVIARIITAAIPVSPEIGLAVHFVFGLFAGNAAYLLWFWKYSDRVMVMMHGWFDKGEETYKPIKVAGASEGLYDTNGQWISAKEWTKDL